jgi:hypothetical protein
MVDNVTGSEMQALGAIWDYSVPPSADPYGTVPIFNFSRMLAEFYRLNGPNGVWNMKVKMERDIGPAIVLCGSSGCDWFDYSTPGNIHYGFIAAAAGVSSELSMVAGGLLQLAEGESDPSWWRTAFEDPRDLAAVNLGYHLYESYGTGLTVEQFQTALTTEIMQTFQPPPSPISEPALPQRNRYPLGYFDLTK